MIKSSKTIIPFFITKEFSISEKIIYDKILCNTSITEEINLDNILSDIFCENTANGSKTTEDFPLTAYRFFPSNLTDNIDKSKMFYIIGSIFENTSHFLLVAIKNSPFKFYLIFESVETIFCPNLFLRFEMFFYNSVEIVSESMK